MRSTSFFEKYFSIEKLSNFYEYMYEYVHIICKYSFGYCPIQYQMLYFWFPLLYVILRAKRKKETYNEKHDSTLNYLFLISLSFFKKLLNSTVILYLINNIFKKYYYFFKFYFLTKVWFNLSIKYDNFKKNHPWLTWKPVFKKFSYFGLFSFIRSKWYKNK